MVTKERESGLESGLWTQAEPAKASWEIKPYKFGIMIDKIGKDQ